MKKISSILIISILISMILPTASAAELLRFDAQQREYAQQYCIQTSVNGIVQDADGNYAMVITDTGAKSQLLVPVGRQDVLLTSKASVNAVQSIDGLGQELKDDIIEMAQHAQTDEGCNCNECNTISIYSPELLPAAESYYYQYYDGHRMKVELITGDAHAGFTPLVKGNNFVGILSAIVGIVIAVNNVDIPKEVSIFGAGVSLLQEIFEHASVNNVYPSSTNSVEAKIRFSYVHKYTFGELSHLSGDWLLGCVSSSATISEYIFSYDFYADNGTRNAAGELYIWGNETIKTENFDSGHLRTAWLNLTHPWHDGQIEIGIGPKTFVLS